MSCQPEESWKRAYGACGEWIEYYSIKLCHNDSMNGGFHFAAPIRKGCWLVLLKTEFQITSIPSIGNEVSVVDNQQVKLDVDRSLHDFKSMRPELYQLICSALQATPSLHYYQGSSTRFNKSKDLMTSRHSNSWFLVQRMPYLL
jgi:hypothetical protein